MRGAGRSLRARRGESEGSGSELASREAWEREERLGARGGRSFGGAGVGRVLSVNGDRARFGARELAAAQCGADCGATRACEGAARAGLRSVAPSGERSARAGRVFCGSARAETRTGSGLGCAAPNWARSLSRSWARCRCRPRSRRRGRGRSSRAIGSICCSRSTSTFVPAGCNSSRGGPMRGRARRASPGNPRALSP